METTKSGVKGAMTAMVASNFAINLVAAGSLQFLWGMINVL